MPQLSGVEVARAVRSWPSDVYIVGCTGNALEEDIAEYRAAGADNILPKPIHQGAIVEQLDLARERLQVDS
jgi:CheY-like chemotaxis protein